MSLWYIGAPCYAIENARWHDFCMIVNSHDNSAFEGNGVEFNWNWIEHQRMHHDTYFEELEVHKTSRVYVYNSGLGGDGEVNVHGYKLGVDAGLLSVLPLEVCHKLTDAEKMVGQQGGHAIIESYYRPVFTIDTDNYPHVQLEYTTSVFDPITGTMKRGDNKSDMDDTGMGECDMCGEAIPEHSITNNEQGAVGDCCYEEEEEYEGDENNE